MKTRLLAIGAVGALVAAPLVLVVGSKADAALPAITCNLVVPPAPLTAQGLATPYVLEGANGNDCTEANAGTSAFVQAAIVAPTGAVTIYSPLVITAGTQPAAAPVLPTVPPGSVVGIWGGFNGVDIHIIGPGVTDPLSNCINGLAGSDFGQFWACNAQATFAAADALASTAATVPTAAAPAGISISAKAGSIVFGPALKGNGVAPQDSPVTTTPVATTVPVTPPTTAPALFPIPPTVPTTVPVTAPTTVPVRTVGAPLLTVPPIGNELNGTACPTTRSFEISDQDPADNVQSKYLTTGGGQTAQDTAFNRFTLQGAAVISNPSDNALLSTVVLPAIGCHSWMLPNAADPGSMVTSLFADQLQAQFYQTAPYADVPLSDEMTLDSVNDISPVKTELYRSLVDEPIATTPLGELTFEASDEVTYCTGLATVGASFLAANQGFLSGFPTPIAGASNLFTFLANRFVMTYEMILPQPGVVPTCDAISGIADPIAVATDGNGVVISATITVGSD